MAVAQSDDIVKVEGNAYFPREALKEEYAQERTTNTGCPWKGTASYYSPVVDGQENPDAVCSYPEPKDAAKKIKGRVSFWRGVKSCPTEQGTD